MNNVKKILKQFLDTQSKTIVDNDFEHVYQMPIVAFEKYSKDEIIEAFYLYLAILEENRIELPLDEWFKE